MIDKLRTYVVGHRGISGGYHVNWLNSLCVDDMSKCDIVVLTGGEDWSPSYYGEPAHPLTSPNPARDRFEWPEMKRAVSMGKPLLGICRGAQGLCALAGGKLVQHQSSQGSTHGIMVYKDPTNKGCAQWATDSRGGEIEEITVSSCHHQAQFPWGISGNAFRILGWSLGLSETHEDGYRREIVHEKPEVEICYYPTLKALGIQSHPEFSIDRSQPYMRMLVSLLLDNKL